MYRRLKPGGGGVNAAIYNAAGASLETATKERANSLAPGKAVVIPLPADSPLLIKEGVKHVIHVLGPNMNPQRPNCLKNNYDEGCKILREAYSSLFEGFASIVETDLLESKGNNRENHSKSELSDNRTERNDNASELKMKREVGLGEERSKKYKGLKYEVVSGNNNIGNSEQHDKSKRHVGTSKTWGSWAQALYNIAMNPEKHKDDVLEITTDVVVLNDAYPKVKTVLCSCVLEPSLVLCLLALLVHSLLTSRIGHEKFEYFSLGKKAHSCARTFGSSG